MRIAIRADSGTKAGLGHLGRCMALAQAIEERRDFKPVFINSDEQSIDWITRKGFPVIGSNHKSWDIVIADSYRFSSRELKAMRASAGTLVLIDDLGLVRAPCDWVLNSSVGAHKISYANARASGFLLGPKFHPLRREFRSTRIQRTIGKKVKNILIVLGGGDGWGFLKTVVLLTRGILPEASLHVVVGPLAAPARELQGKGIFIHQSPGNMRELMERCDVAVSGGGQTLYELAFTGLPTIAALLADNQKYNVDGFESAGFILSCGSPENKNFPATFKRHLKHLTQDAALRARMAQMGQGLVDGRGGLRVAQVLLNALKP